ncbi:MAG: hypothetical protein IIV04_00240 [Bacteroidaceae bacterium]|nr:hypothetical protein [Bacteroidaceae bacterium]
MKTKKNYIIPEICEYSILTTAMICQSAVSAGGDDDYVEEGDALSGEYRSDWENIWANM